MCIRDRYQLDHSNDKLVGLMRDKNFGTVGAVACDEGGNIAAATSTGGMTNKRYGRIGDSPLIGAGTYANNKTCAISCTCLLYTSDAADERSSVDLGGRRIIKKKKMMW